MGLVLSPSFTPVDPLSGIYPIGVPAMAPIQTTPTAQAATQAAIDVAPSVGAGGGGLFGGLLGGQQNPHYAADGTMTNPGFAQKGGLLDVGLGALQTLGNLWNSFQQVKLAKDTFNFQKQAYSTNLANQESTYNTTLTNRENSRGSFEGRSQADTDAYVKAHSL